MSGAIACDHPLDGHVSHGPWCDRQPWDTATHMSPDPAWPAEEQLAWWSAAALVLTLNASETCRQHAAREGNRSAARAREQAAP